MIIRSLFGACVAMLIGACGVVDSSEPAAAVSTTEQGILFQCDGSATWTRYWYTNNVEVGRDDCDCTGIVTPHGTHGSTYTQVTGVSCGGGGGGCAVTTKSGGTSNFVQPPC